MEFVSHALFAAADGHRNTCRLPLVWLDPDTGRVLATRDLAVAGPGVAVTAARNFVAVAAAGRAYLLNSP